MIAGHVDLGENFTQCMIREAAEEADVILTPADLQVAHIMHRRSTTIENKYKIDTFFLAKQWTGDITNKEPHKCDDLFWFDLDNLPENLIPYIKQAIDCIKSQIFYSEHGW